MTSLYEKDFHAWSLEQANYLRLGNIARLDMDHLIEEIETLSNSDKKSMVSYLCNYFLHMLKVKYQPQKYTRSWDTSIKLSLIKAKRILKKYPSFKPLLKEFMQEAYEDSRYEASRETGLELEIFPEECPWTLEEILKNEG